MSIFTGRRAQSSELDEFQGLNFNTETLNPATGLKCAHHALEAGALERHVDLELEVVLGDVVAGVGAVEARRRKAQRELLQLDVLDVLQRGFVAALQQQLLNGFLRIQGSSLMGTIANANTEPGANPNPNANPDLDPGYHFDPNPKQIKALKTSCNSVLLPPAVPQSQTPGQLIALAKMRCSDSFSSRRAQPLSPDVSEFCALRSLALEPPAASERET